MLFFSEAELSPTVASQHKGKEQVLQCLHSKISAMNLVHWHVMSQLPGRKPKPPLKNLVKKKDVVLHLFLVVSADMSLLKVAVLT